MTFSSIVTFPVMLLTPTTSNTSDRLFGVKTTSNRVAEKLLLAMQGFSEVEVSMRSAHVSGDAASRRVEINDAIDGFMIAVAVRVCREAVWGCCVDWYARRLARRL